MNHNALIVAAAGSRLILQGSWTLANYRSLVAQIAVVRSQVKPEATVDIGQVSEMDTAGASLLIDILGQTGLQRLIDHSTDLPPARRALLQAVAQALPESYQGIEVSRTNALGDVLVEIGEFVVALAQRLLGLIGFMGLTLVALLNLLIHPGRLRLTALVANLEKTAFNAVPIIALLTFLIGAVVAFLGATVLVDFGASIYTVDLIAYSFLREFGVLLTAVLVAGRTASAYAAQIGSMRVNEEIDAIRVLGLDPVELLVVPRVLALLFTLPILTFIAMICGLVGGMLVCAVSLDISPTMYMNVIASNIGERHFYIGMAKAPIFAVLIALIGCLEGLRVEGSAESVGEHTTSAVVQSIFVVIVVDAFAAMFCMEMGW